jgi:hypothetical protein
MYTVTITFTLAGSDVGPFDLYSDADGYTTPFATGILAATLLAGYTSTVVPDASTTILARSTGVCTRDLYMPIVGAPTTTTTTTIIPPTTTTTTTSIVPHYSVVLTSCSEAYSYFQISGFTAGDVVLLEADFSGLLNAPITSGYGTRADIFITDGVTGNSDSSPCYPYPNSSQGFSINSQITITMAGASTVINTTAITNNSSSSTTSMSLKIVSVNGNPVGISGVGCKGNSSGTTC